MNVLTPPRHVLVERALRLARAWCRGQTIDDAPALRHAVLVARTLGDLVPNVAPELVAAALLHDAELFAPSRVLLDATLNSGVGPGVAPIVRGIAAEHAGMDRGELPSFEDRNVVLVSGADKVVAFRALIRRAHRSGNPELFWAKRTRLRELLPYFGEWTRQAEPHLPLTVSCEVNAALADLRAEIGSPPLPSISH